MSSRSDTIAMIGPWLFGSLFAFRYTRTVVSIFAFNTYQPKPVLKDPSFIAGDVTVIIPTTFKVPAELVKCIRRIRPCSPAEIFIVTADANVELAQTLCGISSFTEVTVLGVAKLNKRNQILKAMEYVKTAITVLVDDDVFWPDDYLQYLLAIFEDPRVGAGGTRQRVQRNQKPDMWNFLGISYLERRVWNNCATNAIDGSVSTLSGRTAAYRTEILQTPEFSHCFTHDTWRGKPLNSDDDKCLTRYIYSHGWKIALQFDPRSVIETTVEPDIRYLSQCMRWARAHWRGNLIVMENESYWRSLRYWWGFYYIYLGQWQTPALLVDGLLFLFLWLALADASAFTSRIALACLGLWMMFTKVLKLIPHFKRHPSDMKFIPLSIAFSYFHGIMNVYALCSMHVTHWGSQNLQALEETRAKREEVVPLLKELQRQADGYKEPTPGNVMLGSDYFSASRTNEIPFSTHA